MPDATAALSQAEIGELVMPPYQLGEPAGLDGVWTIETSGGELAGYVFETKPLAPIPGFSGDPINLLITIDRDGRFLDVTILEQNEPIFISGLGPGPFHDFVQQYRGLSIGDSITVSSGRRPDGEVGLHPCLRRRHHQGDGQRSHRQRDHSGGGAGGGARTHAGHRPARRRAAPARP